MVIKFDNMKKKAKQYIQTGNLNAWWPDSMADLCYSPFGGAEALVIAIDEFKSIDNPSSIDWRSALDQLRKEACLIVDKWDVRCVDKFIQLFPFVVPKKYLNKGFHCEMLDNENCDWVIIFN